MAKAQYMSDNSLGHSKAKRHDVRNEIGFCFKNYLRVVYEKTENLKEHVKENLIY